MSERERAAAVSDADGDRYDLEPRKGNLLRWTDERTVTAVCEDCGVTFENTGAAASHARSQRHTVDCQYSTRFRFVPRENRGLTGSPP